METPIVKLHRYQQDWNQTLGTLAVLIKNMTPVFSSISLERGWRNNKVSVSCIPADEYDLVYEWSNKFKMMLWEIKNVPNRSECKIHAANLWTQLNGCVAPGTSPRDINGDGYIDVTSSKPCLLYTSPSPRDS